MGGASFFVFFSEGLRCTVTEGYHKHDYFEEMAPWWQGAISDYMMFLKPCSDKEIFNKRIYNLIYIVGM